MGENVASEVCRHSPMQTIYGRTKNYYLIEIWHDGLNKYQAIKKDDPDIAREAANAKMAEWNEMWRRRAARLEAAENAEFKRRVALQETAEAQADLNRLESILSDSLRVSNAIDWEALKDRTGYPEPRPTKPSGPRLAITPEPTPKDERYRVRRTLLDRLFPSRQQVKWEKAKMLFRKDYTEWHTERKQAAAEYKAAVDEYERALRNWERGRTEYVAKQETHNARIDGKKEKYIAAEPEAIVEYCSNVLEGSAYPDCFPKLFEVDYNPENKLLVVDYDFPAPADLPDVCEVKYVPTYDSLVKKQLSEAQKNALYDAVLYKVALRTVHELYDADRVLALESIVFNGYVTSFSLATGQETRACVLSLQANRGQFEGIVLENVDVKACFKTLKGVGSSKLHSITPVAPLIALDRDDKRFVAGYEVADRINEGYNLAAMDWEDFEHLIRELFEKEFAASGGDVKVTRASRDGGVDAVAFDPDPIRGGKIAIQAKRYTNPVGVGAVRDLYGTILNEGANKGILVTTSNFGPDAYEFARGKPITLLDGGNLLHLLEKHGHKARIDLKEAKRVLGEQKGIE